MAVLVCLRHDSAPGPSLYLSFVAPPSSKATFPLTNPSLPPSYPPHSQSLHHQPLQRIHHRRLGRLGGILAGALASPRTQDPWLVHLPGGRSVAGRGASVSHRRYAHSPQSFLAHHHGKTFGRTPARDTWDLFFLASSFLLWVVLVGRGNAGVAL